MGTAELNGRLENYNFFSYIFMTLPEVEFIQKMLQLEFKPELRNEAGVQLLEGHIKSCAVKTILAVLKELLIDRTQLLRNVSEKGCPPPYESLYVKRPPQDVIGELTLLYNKAKYCLSEEIHESREYIGVELNFMSMLCAKQLEALNDNDFTTAMHTAELQFQFFNEHLIKWVPDFAQEMYKVAQTDFYKGIALMLEDWFTKESAYFTEGTFERSYHQ